MKGTILDSCHAIPSISNKLVTKSKYYVVEPYYKEDSTPDQLP
ncbi:MAG: hypothetical protein ACXWFC_07045 [Nitrososphaeraceae archaeon]